MGDRYCRGAHIREVNHPLGGTREVGALCLYTANMSVRHQLEFYRFGSIHTSRLFALHAEELTVGEYLKYAPPREISVRYLVDEFHFISTINALGYSIVLRLHKRIPG